MQPIRSIEEVPNFQSIGELNLILKEQGCRLCSLGFQPEINGCCVSRGSSLTRRMILGEAPGKEEDSCGKPFSGPAGKLMDEIWASVGMSTNDWYITNVCLCRPYMPRGSGKENFTPKQDQRDKCKIYLNKQIGLVNPRIIVTIGAVALEAILGHKVVMGEHRGKLQMIRQGFYGMLGLEPIWIFPMIHPAAILHCKGDKERYDMYRQQTWDDIRELKRILTEKGI